MTIHKPRQGTRERVFALVSFLTDDNGDMVENSIAMIAGTRSDKVANLALQVYRDHSADGTNGITVVHSDRAEQYLPSLLAEILDPSEKTVPSASSEPSDPSDLSDAILGMLDTGEGEQ